MILMVPQCHHLLFRVGKKAGEEGLSIQLPLFQSIHRPQRVYQNPPASSRDVEMHGTLGGDICRRHACHGILQQHSSDPVSLSEHRIPNQQEEVSVETHPGNRISWNDHQCHRDGYKTPGPKDQGHQARSPETSQSPQSLSTVAITADSEAECNHPSSLDGPALLPCTPYMSETGFGSWLTGLPNHQLNYPSKQKKTFNGGNFTYPIGMGEA